MEMVPDLSILQVMPLNVPSWLSNFRDDKYGETAEKYRLAPLSTAHEGAQSFPSDADAIVAWW
jgi:hypothetical protein